MARPPSALLCNTVYFRFSALRHTMTISRWREKAYIQSESTGGSMNVTPWWIGLLKRGSTRLLCLTSLACVQLPTSADNVALPAIAADRRRCSDRTTFNVRQQETSGGRKMMRHTDGQTDTRPFHRPCSAQCASSVTVSKCIKLLHSVLQTVCNTQMVLRSTYGMQLLSGSLVDTLKYKET